MYIDKAALFTKDDTTLHQNSLTIYYFQGRDVIVLLEAFLETNKYKTKNRRKEINKHILTSLLTFSPRDFACSLSSRWSF